MKNSWLFIAAIVVVALAIYLVLTANPTRVSENGTGSVLEGAGLINVLAADMDGRDDVTVDHILSGEDAVLVLNMQTAPKAILNVIEQQHDASAVANSSIYVFNDLHTLAQFDADNTLTIDGQDPIYPSLSLLVFRRGKINELLSLFNAGVRAINIDPNYLRLEVVQDMSRFGKPAAQIVMADSSQRNIKVVPMNLQYFQSTPGT